MIKVADFSQEDKILKLTKWANKRYYNPFDSIFEGKWVFDLIQNKYNLNYVYCTECGYHYFPDIDSGKSLDSCPCCQEIGKSEEYWNI